MPRIFLSYRRQDSKEVTGRIHEHLARVFGEGSIFRDVYDIAAGSDFRSVLNQEVEKSDTFLAIIGPQWVSITDAKGQPRLQNPNDFVRIEVESALKRPGIRVIPILVDNAVMPQADELPESLRELAYRNAFAVRPDPDFPHDMQMLIRQLRPHGPRFGWQKWAAAGVAALAVVAVVLYLALGQQTSGNPGTGPTDAPTTAPLTVPPPSTSELPVNSHYPVIHSFSIYHDASEDSLIVARAQSGAQVTILEQNDDQSWTRVQLEGGQEGWIRTADLVNDIVLSSATEIAVGSGFGARTDAWQLYFTAPGQTSDSPAQLGIDARLADAIDRANQFIDIAAFDFDNKVITEALLEARQRGVRIRMVKDLKNGSGAETVSQLQQAGIEVVDGGRANGLMHDTFIILDGATVWTGSWTYTEKGTYQNNDNALVFPSPQVAAAFEAKFEEMFTEQKFGKHSSPSAANQFTVAKVPVEIYFSPADPIAPRLLGLITGARRSIRFLAFTFTQQDLATALIEKQKSGLPVQGIIESRAASEGEFDPMYCAKINLRTDGNQYSLHHKVIIIDDQIVITGSLNFSNNALTSNDENVVVVQDPRLAAAYNQEFDRLWSVAVQPSGISCP